MNEVASDNDDDDDPNSKDVEVFEIGTGEALTMLDRLTWNTYQRKEKTFLSPWNTN